jgi:HAD superfamily hydrolase (TIGR01509 family)
MKTILVDAVHCFVIADKGIFKEMHDLLETYQNKKIILTGANDQETIKFGLDKMPYKVFSLKHDPEKTDPKYFQIMLEKHGLDKNDVVYFEHAMKAVESARSAGINSYFYDNDTKDLSALKAFLDNNL